MTRYRLSRGRPRSLWGITPIHTITLNANCDKALGISGYSLVFVTYHISKSFNYNFEGVISFVRNWLPKTEHWVYKLTLIYALLRFDVFHFFCDRGILPPTGNRGLTETELELLNASEKRTYFYPYGGDVRTRNQTLALGKVNFCNYCDRVGWHCVCDIDDASRNIELIRKYATALVSMGDMIPYMGETTRMNFWPIDTDKVKPSYPIYSPGMELVVVHAPNHAQFKGTRFLEEAIESLRLRGFLIRYVKLEKMSNQAVLEAMSSAHLIFDQVSAGFHGYTSVEGMAFGKPTICYIRGPDMVPSWDECPMLNATPVSLVSVLEQCLTGGLDLKKIGEESRRYVERHYSMHAVTLNLANLYLKSGNFPQKTLKHIENGKKLAEMFLINKKAMRQDGPYCINMIENDLQLEPCLNRVEL